MRMFDMLPWAAMSATTEGSGGAPAPAPAPAPAEAPDRGVSEEIRSILHFDPFEDGALDEVKPPPAAPEPQVVQAEAPPVPPPPPPAPEPAPADVLATTVQELRQTVQELPNAVRQATQPPPTPEPQVDPFHPKDGEQALNYVQIMSTIPDAALNGLISENPLERKQAVAQVLGVAMHVAHRLAVKQATETLRGEFSRVLPAYVSEHLQTESLRREVHNDFYTAFPQLNHPVLKQVVMREAAVLGPKLGVTSWTPEFRDALGKHVMDMLPQVQAPATAAPAPATPTVGPSARPMTGTGSQSMQQEIADLLGF